MPLLVATFDIATATGVCVGRVGGKPKVATWDLSAGGSSRPARLLYFSNLLDELFARQKIDVVRCEAPLELAGQVRIGTNESVQLFLRGAIGVFEVCAARAKIPDIGMFDVQKAREHLTGSRTFPKNKKGKSTAKLEVWKVAKMLGVKCADYEQSDAFCGFSYTCALLNPRLAMLVTPLFSGKRPAA